MFTPTLIFPLLLDATQTWMKENQRGSLPQNNFGIAETETIFLRKDFVDCDYIQSKPILQEIFLP